MSKRLQRHLIVAIVLLSIGVVGGAVYFHQLSLAGAKEIVPLSQELKTIPKELGDWTGVDIPFTAETLTAIGAEDTLRRSYAARRGTQKVTVDLYIAYFGGIRGTAPHHPDVCMPGAGWNILDRDLIMVRVKGFGDEPLEVHKDVFEKTSGQTKRLVVWWEFIHGENIASRYWQRLKWVLPSFLGGKRGSILQVQVGVGFQGDTSESMVIAEEFMDRLGPYLKQVLPKDAPANDATAAR